MKTFIEEVMQYEDEIMTTFVMNLDDEQYHNLKIDRQNAHDQWSIDKYLQIRE